MSSSLSFQVSIFTRGRLSHLHGLAKVWRTQRPSAMVPKPGPHPAVYTCCQFLPNVPGSADAYSLSKQPPKWTL